MWSQKMSELGNKVEIATQAIMQSLGYKLGDDTIVEQAFDLSNDLEFNEIIKSVASAMNLRFIRVHPVHGIELLSKDRGPFAPMLGWISKKLNDPNTNNVHERRLYAGLVLIAIMSEFAPTVDSLREGLTADYRVKVEDIVKGLKDIAVGIIEGSKAENPDVTEGYLSAARCIVDDRLQSINVEESNVTSALRSQNEMIRTWLRILEEYGYVATETDIRGDVYYFASERLRNHLRATSIKHTVDFVLNMKPGHDSDASFVHQTENDADAKESSDV